MWILNWIPDYIVHICLAASIVAVALSAGKNYFMLLLSGIVILVCTSWYEGIRYSETKYQLEVDKYKTELSELKSKSNEATTVISTKLVNKLHVIKEKGDTVIEYVDREVTKYDSQCVLPSEVIISHNAAALNQSIK